MIKSLVMKNIISINLFSLEPAKYCIGLPVILSWKQHSSFSKNTYFQYVSSFYFIYCCTLYFVDLKMPIAIWKIMSMYPPLDDCVQ